jgi:hypothetical protein
MSDFNPAETAIKLLNNEIPAFNYSLEQLRLVSNVIRRIRRRKN